MSANALIGATGFVGSNLARQHRFEATFDSLNIDELGSAAFGTVVCAAAPGSMLLANRDPESDAAALKALEAHLARSKTSHFVLISSIAVLQRFDGGDDEDTTAFQTKLAYGRNRRELEKFCAANFDRCLVVRLPALFGAGLKKNFIFDLANPLPSYLTAAAHAELKSSLNSAAVATLSDVYAWDSRSEMQALNRTALAAHPGRAALEEQTKAAGLASVRFHNPDTTYQYYALDRLWSDIQTALAKDLSVLHCAIEPLRARDIHTTLLKAEMPDTGAPLHREDMQTRHAEHFCQTGRYLGTADQALSGLEALFPTLRRTA